MFFSSRKPLLLLLVFALFGSCPGAWANECEDAVWASQANSIRSHFAQSGLPVLVVVPIFSGEFQSKGVWIDMTGRVPNPRLKRINFRSKTLSEAELAGALVRVREDGKLSKEFGVYNLIYVVTESGNFRVWPIEPYVPSLDRVKHSALANGENVLMAGEIELKMTGEIFSVSNKSGHYHPSSQHLAWFVEYLQTITSISIRSKAQSSR